MTSRATSLRRWAWLLVGLVIGAGLIAALLANRQTPTQGETGRRAPTLSVIEVQPLDLWLTARGHGTARAAETWRATANVGGRVVERHPDLASGNILPEGARLLALDDTRYRLAIAEAEAERASVKAELRQLDVEADNIQRLLEMARERLALSEKELERREELAESDRISRSRRDEQRRATIAQRKTVAELKNELALIPSRRKQLAARQEQAKAQLEQAHEDLKDTRFEAPYDLRVSDVDVEMHDQVSAGEVLFRANSIEAAEVEAHVPLAMLRRVIGAVAQSSQSPRRLNIHERVDFSRIDAAVVLAGVRDVQWSGGVTRIASGLDPATRTVRVVITVDEPYKKANPPEQPALQPGMYVRVRLKAPSPEPRLVVPASAVHAGEVYRVTKENTLARQPVEVAFEQDDLAVIAKGLSPGDRIIVDDPMPTIEGMTVSPQQDQELQRDLRARARGGSQ